jgi:4-amino-4-deoxy-L-arabinose transferase-like glycosyltransferase
VLKHRLSTAGPYRKPGASLTGPLIAILVLAFTLRLLAVIWFNGTIDPEGAEYARIAENLAAGKGYYGIATPGKELMLPPLFPFLIAATSLLTHQAELAGRLVSMLMGTTLALTVFLLSRHLYGLPAASIAALLAAVHPYLISMSATVYCESTYLTLILTAVYVSFRALQGRKTGAFLLAGVLYGLSYLTRPEAAIYPFVAVALTLVYVSLTDRHDLGRVALRSICMPATFLVLAAPYVLWLHEETGQWRLEGKSPLNYTTGLRMLGALDQSEVKYGVDNDLTERGVWIKSNLSTIQDHRFKASEVVFYLRARLKQIANYLVGFTSQKSFGSPPLFLLAMYGLFRRPWHRELAVYQLFLLIILGFTSSALFFIFYLADRFLLLFVPVLTVWASKGILELARWAASTIGLLCGRIPKFPQLQVVLALTIAAAIPVISVPGAYDIHVSNRKTVPLRIAGEWLNTYAPGPKTVMDIPTVLAFHAVATFVPFPYSDSDVAIRYMDKRNVNFIVLSDYDDLSSRPYLKKWMEKGIPNSRAKLIYNANDEGRGRILIYKWNAANSATAPASTHESAAIPQTARAEQP